MSTTITNWRITTLGDVCKVESGGTPSTSRDEYWNGNIPWITPKDLADHNTRFIENGERHITKEGLENSSAKLLPKNTVLFSSRAPIGYVAIADRELATNQGFKNIICDEKEANFEFIFYWLKVNTHAIERRASGSTFGEASASLMKSQEILLPPYREQRSIASVLASLDDKIELLRKQNETLEAIARAIFHEWFVEFNFPNEQSKPYKASGGKMIDSELDEIPDGWKVGNLFEIARVLSGGTPKTDREEFWGDSIPFFTPKDVGGDVYVLSTEKYLSEAGLQNCNSQLFPINTVFITARGTVGRVAMAGIPMAMNQSCYALQSKNSTDQLFLFLLIKKITSELQSQAHGTVFSTITLDTFKALDFITPSPAAIASFTETVGPIFEKVLASLMAIKALATVRDLLLPKLMSGEVRVRT